MPRLFLTRRTTRIVTQTQVPLKAPSFVSPSTVSPVNKSISSPFLFALDYENPYISSSLLIPRWRLPVKCIRSYFNIHLSNPEIDKNCAALPMFQSLVRFPSFWIPTPRVLFQKLCHRLVWKFLCAPHDSYKDDAFRTISALTSRGIEIAPKLADRLILHSQAEVAKSEENLQSFVNSSLKALEVGRYNSTILYVLMTSLFQTGHIEEAERLFRDWANDKGIYLPLPLSGSGPHILQRAGYDTSNTKMTAADFQFLPRLFALLIRISSQNEDGLQVAYRWFIIFRLRFCQPPGHLINPSQQITFHFSRPYVELMHSLARFPRRSVQKINHPGRVRLENIVQYMIEDGFNPLTSTSSINAILKGEQELNAAYYPPHSSSPRESVVSILQRYSPTFGLFQYMIAHDVLPDAQTFKHILVARFRIRFRIEYYGFGGEAPDMIPSSTLQPPKLLTILNLPPPDVTPIPTPRNIVQAMVTARMSRPTGSLVWQTRMKLRRGDVWDGGNVQLTLLLLIYEGDFIAAWTFVQWILHNVHFGPKINVGAQDEFFVPKIFAAVIFRWEQGRVSPFLDHISTVDLNSPLGVVLNAYLCLGKTHQYNEVDKLDPKAATLLRGHEGLNILGDVLRMCDSTSRDDELWKGNLRRCFMDIFSVDAQKAETLLTGLSQKRPS